jgi:hypothetical protein
MVHGAERRFFVFVMREYMVWNVVEEGGEQV